MPSKEDLSVIDAGVPSNRFLTGVVAFSVGPSGFGGLRHRLRNVIVDLEPGAFLARGGYSVTTFGLP
jgi:hypothetical protein